MSSVDRIVTDPQTFKRVSRELRKLSFNNPGPQMKSNSAPPKSEPSLSSRRRSKLPQHAQIQTNHQKRHRILHRRAKDKKIIYETDHTEVHTDHTDTDSDCQVVVDEEMEKEEFVHVKCDCLQPNCPGCFFACETCGSHYCGVKCKRLRSWNYTSVIREESA